MTESSVKSIRPLWREPIVLAIAMVVLLASLCIWYQDRLLPGQPAVDPGNKAALPPAAGGSFCDLPAPTQSTAFNPSTRNAQ